MPSTRMHYQIVDEWPEDAPTPAVRFDVNVPPELRDRAVLAALTADDAPEQEILATPTLFEGRRQMRVRVRITTTTVTTVTREVILSTHHNPQHDRK